MGYFPVYLDLRGRPCAVIGTGHEADGKTQALLDAGAVVKAVTAEPTKTLKKLSADGRIDLIERDYRKGDLAGVFLAVSVTTHDRALSERITSEAREHGVLLNVVDVTDLCTWIAPAIVRRGDITVAVSTNGLSPAIARYIRERVDEALPQVYGDLLEIAASVRTELRRQHVRPHPAAWQRALDAETLQLLSEGQKEEARSRLLTTLYTPRDD